MASTTSKRTDGRASLLVYLKPDLVKALKLRALREDTHVYILVEKMLSDAMGEQEHDRSE